MPFTRADNSPDAVANPSRRRVVFAGAAGLAALALARLLQLTPFKARSGLSENGTEIMRALLPAFLDGALPEERVSRETAIDETMKAVARAVDGLPSLMRHELEQLFTLLAFAPVRIAVAGVDEPWRRASVASVDAFLARWRESRLVQKRAAYDALHQLAFAAWYANPRAWPAIGYPGPPDLS